MQKSPTQLKNSEIIGLISPDKEGSSLPGLERSGTDAVPSLPVPQAKRDVTEEPASLVLFRHVASCSTKIVRSGDLPLEQQLLPLHKQPIGLMITSCELSKERRREFVTHASLPCDRDLAVMLLGSLANKTRTQSSKAGDWKSVIADYANDIEGNYPAFLVKAVLRMWPKKSEFWPTWRELEVEFQKESVVLNRLCRQLLEMGDE